MEFNSIEFLLFLPLVMLVFFLSPQRWRWIVLLLASYWFYMAWVPKFAILIVLTTTIDYLVARKIHSLSDDKLRKRYLILSIIANLGILIHFKYNDFFIENINEMILGLGGRSQIPLLKLVLPMGISFYTFQEMAYTIDVYRKRLEPERHFGYFALYVTYFPQLVAGPIERAEHLLGQFRKKVSLTYENLSWGVKQIIWGFFKKVVIADRLAEVVDQVYNNPAQYDGLSFIFASYLFAVQIYCDFSGYSDIAIGTSRIFGIKLMDNFNVPYLAKSFGEFWRKWHISLSGWFKDYLYIPLGGKNVKKGRWLFNIFIVFLVSGFWHGAAWTYVIWGALHGLYLVTENAFGIKPTEGRSSAWETLGRRFIVFNLVVFAWIFFRANTVEDSFYIVSHLHQWDLSVFMDLLRDGSYLKSLFILALVTGFVVADARLDKLVKTNPLRPYWESQLFFSFITALILIFGYFGEAQFIYFQF